MILSAIGFTKTILDQYLKNKFGLDDSNVVINKIVNSDGSLPGLNQNKVVLSLINIEKETLKPFNVQRRKLADGNYARTPMIDRFNLDLLLTSNFDNYEETLKFLDAGMLFFQGHPSIDSGNYATIPEGIKKLDYELDKISYHEMHSLWSAMGAKYTPSVIYKIRLVHINPDVINGFETAVQKIDNTINS